MTQMQEEQSKQSYFIWLNRTTKGRTNEQTNKQQQNVSVKNKQNTVKLNQ